jgi:hydroxymethylpyrimidine/phosphomethylpyrimidine kinase
VGVNRVDALPAAAVIAQIEAVVDDIGVQAVKTGMLLNQDIIQAVADYWQQLSAPPPLVVDPVMVSRTGAQLIDDAAIATLTQSLIPTGSGSHPQPLRGSPAQRPAHSNPWQDMEAAAIKIQQLGSAQRFG